MKERTLIAGEGQNADDSKILPRGNQLRLIAEVNLCAVLTLWLWLFPDMRPNALASSNLNPICERIWAVLKRCSIDLSEKPSTQPTSQQEHHNQDAYTLLSLNSYNHTERMISTGHFYENG